MAETSDAIEQMQAAIIAELARVIDPETGADVVRMRLVEDLTVHEGGRVSYTFRPSSALCPIAVPLALMIKTAVSVVPGVVGQTISVKNYVQAEILTEWLNLET
jgi:metal-sulfur cluster biosynthetic enzyme